MGGKAAIVTGGANGIGREIAPQLAAALMAYRDGAGAEAVAALHTAADRAVWVGSVPAMFSMSTAASAPPGHSLSRRRQNDRQFPATAPPQPGGRLRRRPHGRGSSFPDKDETEPEDGWGVFSGTSAACPMVAGTVALILCKYPGADLEEVRERLRRAQDVTEGHSSMEDPAGPGYDAATGHGLVNVEQACI